MTSLMDKEAQYSTMLIVSYINKNMLNVYRIFIAKRTATRSDVDLVKIIFNKKNYVKNSIL